MDEKFIVPTYEEYLKATNWARIRYKYGLVVTMLANILLIILIIYIIIYAKELSTMPLQYGAEKYKLQCSCSSEDGLTYKFNESEVYITEDPLVNFKS